MISQPNIDRGSNMMQDAKNKETNGFRSRMGSRGAAPRLLRLKPEDVEKVGQAPLQKGKFTWVTESGREERWIVATCGQFTVLWNFRYFLCQVTQSMHQWP